MSALPTTLAALRRLGRPVRVTNVLRDDSAYWTLQVRPPGLAPVSAMFFRGVPTQLGAFSFNDPFGPVSFNFTLPAVTYFEQLGVGDLNWIAKDADVDLIYHGPLPAGYPADGFRFEGYIASFDWSNGLAISCIGALRQADNYLAKPEYAAQPMPYEWAIARQLMGRADLHFSPLRMEWPTWWSTRYSDPPAGTPSWLVPTGVKSGDNWTAMLTRDTGSWVPALSNYIQGMLTAMYTERGRFTIDLDPGRLPVLRHRDIITSAVQPGLVVIDPAHPDVKLSLSEDWTQSANAAYGQGTSLSGVGFTGQHVSEDGTSTFYVPLAAARQVEPATDSNGWYQRTRMRREVMLQVQQGLNEDQAVRMATSHLTRFGDPGVTGTITMGIDPMLGGQVLSRALVKAGMSVQLPRLFGSRDGIIALVTQSSYDFSSDKVTLTIDTRYRDQLTVDEVRVRGRDALNVPRMLVVGGYSPPVPDQLVPWNYAAGSGFIPSGPQLSSLRLFTGMPQDLPFPWTDWTTKRPPSAAAWKSCYIHLAPASNNADSNWGTTTTAVGSGLAIPIKMAQAGQIRLLQLAAYDANGNVLPVGFHASLWMSSGANPASTPALPADLAAQFPPYQAAQHYPFFPGAWEKYNVDGTLVEQGVNDGSNSAGLVRAWGGPYEKAGYYPGSSASGNPATGLLVDEATWNFDTTNFDASYFDPYSKASNASNPLAGQLYLLIFCEDQLTRDVYFAGRMYRVEPGTGV